MYSKTSLRALSSGVPLTLVNQFDLSGREEALRHRLVPAGSLAAHAAAERCSSAARGGASAGRGTLQPVRATQAVSSAAATPAPDDKMAAADDP